MNRALNKDISEVGANTLFFREERERSGDTYFRLMPIVEKLYRTHLKMIQYELKRMGVGDISDINLLVLYSIGDQELSVGQISELGYYMGSNISYNLKKMVKSGYLIQEPSSSDRRSDNIKLSKKAMELLKKFDGIFSKYSEMLSSKCISYKNVAKGVFSIDRVWSELLDNKKIYN